MTDWRYYSSIGAASDDEITETDARSRRGYFRARPALGGRLIEGYGLGRLETVQYENCDDVDQIPRLRSHDYPDVPFSIIEDTTLAEAAGTLRRTTNYDAAGRKSGFSTLRSDPDGYPIEEHVYGADETRLQSLFYDWEAETLRRVRGVDGAGRDYIEFDADAES